MKNVISLIFIIIALGSSVLSSESINPMTNYFDCTKGSKEICSFTFIDTDLNGSWDNAMWFDCEGKSFYSDISESPQVEIPEHRIGYGEIISGSFEIGKDFKAKIFVDEEKTDLWAIMSYVSDLNTFYILSPDLNEKLEISEVLNFSGSINKFDVYPNPAQTEITVTLDCKVDQNFNLKIHSLNWVEVSENYYIIGQAGSKIETIIPIDDLSSGTYHVRIESTDGKSTFFKKVIIE